MQAKHISTIATLGAASVYLFAAAMPANAAYIVDFSQVGSDVVATGSGSLNISDLGSPYNPFFTAQPYVDPSVGFIINGTYLGHGAGYNIGISEISYGSGFGADGFTGTGPVVGIQPLGGALFVPVGYVSGTPLGVSTAEFGGTLADLGLTPGTYTTAFGTGENRDTFTVNVLTKVSSVPLPASAPMFGAALLGLFAIGYAAQRKKAASAV